MRKYRRTAQRYFYHTTEEDWGEKKRLYPRKEGELRAENEPQIARICVCPTVFECISATVNMIVSFHLEELFIYRTKRRVRAFFPVSQRISGVAYTVEDVRVTRERWLLRPCMFVRVGSIPQRLIEKMRERRYFSYICGDKDNLDVQRRCLQKVIRPDLRKHLQALELPGHGRG